MILRRLALAALVALLACSDDPPPIDTTFDGNIVVGDAEISERGDATQVDGSDRAEAGSGDAGDGSSRDGELRDGADPVDAEPDAGPSCDEPPSATVSSSVALAAPAMFDGLRIAITGTATVGATTCAPPRCPADDPCCATCTAQVSIDGVIALAASACFARPGCAGNSCGVTCMPPTFGVEETFHGIFRAPSTLELYGIEP